MKIFDGWYDGARLARACSTFKRNGRECPNCGGNLLDQVFEGDVARQVCQDCPTLLPPEPVPTVSLSA